MKFAWTLFILSAAACALFSLGRVVGRLDEINDRREEKKDFKTIKAELLVTDLRESHEDVDCEIEEAQCDTVVVDLKRYKDRKEILKRFHKKRPL